MILFMGTVSYSDSVQKMKESILQCLQDDVVLAKDSASLRDIFSAVAKATMKCLAKKWIATQSEYYQKDAKRVYYISMEFLLGKSLKNNLLNLGILDVVQDALAELNYNFDALVAMEADAGLGNGGLGRLAACYLDSMATLGIPAYGYGIRYDYGIFDQKIIDGYQVEAPDEWLRYGNPWEICRGEYLYPVHFYGKVEHYTDARGLKVATLVDTEDVLAMAYDVPIPGYQVSTVNSLRLWQAQSPKGFSFDYFNHGNYIQAIENIALVENISRVLYPNDSISEGLELRLKQEFFLVSATLQDILRRYTKTHLSLESLADKVSIQLNDTHPALGIAEMMRLLVDREELPWDQAWDITQKVFNYTNHTVLPEALEKWPEDLFSRLLPRHFEIIQEINHRWLRGVNQQYPNNEEKQHSLSIIDTQSKQVRMAYLAIIGSEKVNGVSALHSSLIQKDLFNAFTDFFPHKFLNVTNGITPRRWLALCNPKLHILLKDALGDNVLTDLTVLQNLQDLAADSNFITAWEQIKLDNKKQLAHYILKTTRESIHPESLFDCHIKRIHEYKRQLMNILRVIHVYRELKTDAKVYETFSPTTVIFAGKAAPGYAIAKLIIKLITSVADKVNNDAQTKDKLKVIFLPNYQVSLAEMIIPAADLSEQISTAGMEASGTGNMKFALNGALTIGTQDGATVEMAEHIGSENMFLFGLTEQEILNMRASYSPKTVREQNPKIDRVLRDIEEGVFSPQDKHLFDPILERLLNQGDHFFILADLDAYIRTHQAVGLLFKNQREWTKRSIYNVAGMGYFSSDRAVLEYAKNIWNV